jgi:hypothetical protein
MRENKSDKENPAFEIELPDEAIFVPSNIKHNATAYQIGVPVNRAHFRKVVPICSLGDPIPVIERLSCSSMLHRELPYRPMTYYSHTRDVLIS